MKFLPLVLLCVASLAAPAGGTTLREQLSLARKADDTLSRIEIIRRILDQQPANAELRSQLPDLWISLGDYDMAEQAIDEWPDAPEKTRARVRAAALYERDRRYQEAVAVLEAYHGKEPNDRDIIRQLAGYLADLTLDEKLVDLLQPIDDDAPLLVRRAVARARLHDFDGAIRDFTAAQKIDADASEVKHTAAFIDRLRMAKDPLRAAMDALAVKPDDSAALLNRAYWRLFLDFEEQAAVEDARTAHRLESSSTAAAILLGKALLAHGDAPSPVIFQDYSVDGNAPLPEPSVLGNLIALDQAILAAPQDLSQRLARCRLLDGPLQQYALGLADADAILSQDPKNTPAQVERIFALLKGGRAAEAENEYRKLLANSPPPAVRAAAAGYLIDTFFTLGRMDAALAYADAALAAHPTSALYRQRAAIYQKTNRAAEADADLARARKLSR